jgi:hypothetical protein
LRIAAPARGDHAGGYRVLAADFHTHSSTWSDGSVTPFGMVIDARYQGLDAIAITGHRQTLDAKWGRWFSEQIGGPIVLVGEEIPEIAHHVIAVGIHTTVDSALPIREQVDEIHRQGGVAIAAHPGEFFWPGFEPVMDRLDGTEVCHPATFDYPQFRPENRRVQPAHGRRGNRVVGLFMVRDDWGCAGRSCSCARPARPGSSRPFARNGL